MVVLVFPLMMAVAGAKEPAVAVRAAIRVLKQHMVKPLVSHQLGYILGVPYRRNCRRNSGLRQSNEAITA